MSPKLLNLLLIVLSFTIYYLVISPLYSGVGAIWQPEKSITSLKMLNTQYDQTLSQAEGLLKQADALRREYGSLDEASKQKMLVMVPQNIDPLRLLSEMNLIAAESGIGLGAVTYADIPQATKLAGAYQLSFAVKTTYPKFKEFMHNYENSLRLFSLQAVSFAAPEEPGDLIPFQVKMNTYYLK